MLGVVVVVWCGWLEGGSRELISVFFCEVPSISEEGREGGGGMGKEEVARPELSLGFSILSRLMFCSLLVESTKGKKFRKLRRVNLASQSRISKCQRISQV